MEYYDVIKRQTCRFVHQDPVQQTMKDPDVAALSRKNPQSRGVES